MTTIDSSGTGNGVYNVYFKEINNPLNSFNKVIKLCKNSLSKSKLEIPYNPDDACSLAIHEVIKEYNLDLNKDKSPIEEFHSKFRVTLIKRE